MNGHVECWLWDDTLKLWVKAPAVVTVKRIIATGQVGAVGAHKLFWVSMNPSAANSILEITDDTDGSTAVVFDMYHATRDHMHMLLGPPMPFSNGIWVKTFTSFTSVMFGYV